MATMPAATARIPITCPVASAVPRTALASSTSTGADPRAIG